MDRLWLLEGARDAAGWPALQADAMQDKVNVLSVDPGRWALVKSEQAPEGYQGLAVSDPPAGLYLDNFGRPIYVADLREVHSARAVIKTLGPDAAELLDKLGDADLVLERLGRSY